LAIGARRSLWTHVTLRPQRTGRTGRAYVALSAGRTARTDIALRSLWPYIALRASGSLWTLGTGRAARAVARWTLWTLIACRTLWTGGTSWPLRTIGTGCTGGTGRSRVAVRTCRTCRTCRT
jgi:hypothetical protein